MASIRSVVPVGTAPVALAGLALASVCAAAILFADAIADMWHTWMFREEYSHGPLLPLIALYLAWRRRHEVAAAAAPGTWLSLAGIGVGLMVFAAGRLTTIYVIQQYAALIVAVGLTAAFVGGAAVRVLWAPFVVLALMIPPPYIVLNNLSSGLQLVSSEIGAAMLQGAGISVFVQGNVIDLGAYKLQVAEACSGLNYLFPLATLAFVFTLFFRTNWWQRLLLVVSSIPITVAMNSARIAVIGITVDRWGPQLAEGFLHDFEGWLVFMLSAAMMYGELLVLMRWGAAPGAPNSGAASGSVPVGPGGRPWRLQLGPASGIAAALLVLAALASGPLSHVRQVVPDRERFDRFPELLGTWRGQRASLEQVYLDTLKLDDYLLADYVRGSSSGVNLYVAWYDSQTSGVTTHSPRSCLPGGGWQIVEMREQTLDGIALGTEPLRVNRLVIQSGDQRELVYYWFQQRGRVITNEYLAKWFLFWDALTLHRTDGALVRVVVPVRDAQDVSAGDATIRAFLTIAVARLAPFLPGR